MSSFVFIYDDSKHSILWPGGDPTYERSFVGFLHKLGLVKIDPNTYWDRLPNGKLDRSKFKILA